jgi:hypothetical protein
MHYGHETEILVLILATQIDTIGFQRFEDLKRKNPVFDGTVLCLEDCR